MEEVGFVNQFVDFDLEPTEQLEVVAEDLPNLFDVGIEVGFYVQLVGLDMEITKHLVVDDLVVFGGELYVVEHLIESNVIVGVVSLAYVAKGLHMDAYRDFVATGMDSLVVHVDEDLLMKHYLQFIPRSEHVVWMVKILVFDRIM